MLQDPETKKRIPIISIKGILLIEKNLIIKYISRKITDTVGKIILIHKYKYLFSNELISSLKAAIIFPEPNITMLINIKA